MDTFSHVIAPRLLSMLEAADTLGVSVRTVMRAIQRGELRCVRIGRAVRIEVEALRAYLDLRRR